MKVINEASLPSSVHPTPVPETVSNASGAVIEIFYNTFYIGTTIGQAFAGPFAPLVQGIQWSGTAAYYAVVIPDFAQSCIGRMRAFLTFLKGEGPKVPLITQLNSALEPFNVFGPKKLEAIKNIAILAFKALSWSLFIASFFVMPHIAFCCCLAASAIALSIGIKDLYVHYMNKKTQELSPSQPCAA